MEKIPISLENSITFGEWAAIFDPESFTVKGLI
jgi:hypothetical protein